MTTEDKAIEIHALVQWRSHADRTLNRCVKVFAVSTVVAVISGIEVLFKLSPRYVCMGSLAILGLAFMVGSIMEMVLKKTTISINAIVKNRDPGVSCVSVFPPKDDEVLRKAKW